MWFFTRLPLLILLGIAIVGLIILTIHVCWTLGPGSLPPELR